ncbi:hypothetical protein B0H63DRAFT_483112, partial [Podospora didyma]
MLSTIGILLFTIATTAFAHPLDEAGKIAAWVNHPLVRPWEISCSHCSGPQTEKSCRHCYGGLISAGFCSYSFNVPCNTVVKFKCYRYNVQECNGNFLLSVLSSVDGANQICRRSRSHCSPRDLDFPISEGVRLQLTM